VAVLGSERQEELRRADPALLVTAVLEEETRRHVAQSAVLDDQDIADELLPGVGSDDLPMGDVLRAGGVSMIGVLAGLVLVDNLSNSAFAVLGPDIQKTLHMSDLVLGVVGALGGLVIFAAAIPLGYLGDRTRRTTLVGLCSLVWAAFVMLTGAAQAMWQLIIAWGAAGLGKANEQPIHSALLADAYPIEGRNRVYALHRAAQPVGLVIGPVLAGAVAAVAGGSSGWRWAFVILAIPAAVLGVAAFGLPEPKRGRNEMQSLLGEEMAESEDELRIPIAAAFARLKKIQTFYFFLCALGALGLAFVTAPIYFNLFLDKHFHLGPGGRGLVGSIGALGGVVGVAVGGTAGDRLFRRAPENAVRLSGALVASFGVLVPLSLFMPNVALFTAVSAIGSAVVFAAFVPLTGLVAAVTPYRLRSMGFATIGLYLSLIGGLGGALLVGAVASSLGDRAALVIVTPPAALIGGGLIAYGARFVRRDMALAAAELVEERDERVRMAAGADVPMLQIRHLDYSYGPVQVLFDVNLDVRRGEVLALLGTNGAGKSTLLRAISGLGFADRGVVRLAGRTITFADPGTRVRLGIVQVPGGRAIFPTLSVAENLLAGAYTFIWDREQLASRVDKVLDLFPVLVDRLDQPAETLSGGEQQMLGLASGLLLDPQILLIDELSLGLAPVVVQQLLAIVEQLKASGLTIVIVEQSINVALALADRAVFMEKGEVRFEGPAAELLERDDLVRAVFLGGEGG
jgi:ABC-type branched-subunit amino acid transport system ATPase component/predicted MFS family arabinose efflux permease